MIKKYAIALLFIFAIYLQTAAQVRLVEVDPATETVKLHNYGNASVDVSNYWFCSLFGYGQLNAMTIINGSLNLAPDADIELTSSVALNDTAADLGLYSTNSFGSSTAMLDFTQWGSAGNGRETVAVNKGIWVAGTFVNVAPPYEYTGDGGQNGVQFWDTLLGLDEFSTDQFKILQNPGSTRLLMSLPRANSTYDLVVYDLLGKKMVSKSISGVAPSVDVSKWNSGVYLVRLSSDNITQTKRFVKQ